MPAPEYLNGSGDLATAAALFVDQATATCIRPIHFAECSPLTIFDHLVMSARAPPKNIFELMTDFNALKALLARGA